MFAGRWLGPSSAAAVALGFVTLFVLGLYFAAPDVPKLPAIPVFLVLGYLLLASHHASLSWIEISPDGKTVSGVPSWYARELSSERVRSATISPSSQLLLCLHRAYNCFDGYSAILREPDGKEQVLWKAQHGLDYKRCADFSMEVAGRSGLR